MNKSRFHTLLFSLLALLVVLGTRAEARVHVSFNLGGPCVHRHCPPPPVCRPCPLPPYFIHAPHHHCHPRHIHPRVRHGYIPPRRHIHRHKPAHPHRHPGVKKHKKGRHHRH